MAEEEESFENLDDLDWSDVESELKANKDQILSEVKSDGAGDQQEGKEVDVSGEAGVETGAAKAPVAAGDIDINFLFDVQLSIIVEVGRVQMLISDLLDLDEESIIELDSMVGQPLDIRANDLLVARGEVIVVNEKFAVRITDIISPDNRFAAL
ncbi:MAG: flagellar motor switch protein FliN [Deltaproteobacteria bacterium]|jgi:flagellar motor switch protein FliN/FliY|uniref:Flagellar motor switch protein FliN-like C-terminal domain-containing protein n=1 Tax=marine metagenome TaxID=408172 RepID=A0A381QEL4_9ZZZZ|nr:flagellar motor switch protein FliN [Deltaproteobacteria bacterium]MDP6308051.1 flagellar motor switch protein FliN [SAR324 cluster bacterium]MAF55185.1 flagellar motor switch protein FliN [Deltaproteobacteria bacterium]MDP6430888.1 flagellar motor switch protein FliN [SAR324 cluster bacterium]MDP7175388.1 flagellar motor switch protein FliN [SAR324 cluster bacterium]|tara:strand:+ start:307 stop:768 length:462 start_codon:yes stop_codon:yes gene_type:complete